MPASESGIRAAGGEFSPGGIGNRARDEKGDAGLRGDAGDNVALEIDGEGACVAPSAIFFFLGCEDRARSEYRAFKGADLARESGHTHLERFRRGVQRWSTDTTSADMTTSPGRKCGAKAPAMPKLIRQFA